MKGFRIQRDAAVGDEPKIDTGEGRTANHTYRAGIASTQGAYPTLSPPFWIHSFGKASWHFAPGFLPSFMAAHDPKAQGGTARGRFVWIPMTLMTGNRQQTAASRGRWPEHQTKNNAEEPGSVPGLLLATTRIAGESVEKVGCQLGEK
jgi:hypothetical protein